MFLFTSIVIKQNLWNQDRKLFQKNIFLKKVEKNYIHITKICPTFYI